MEIEQGESLTYNFYFSPQVQTSELFVGVWNMGGS